MDLTSFFSIVTIVLSLSFMIFLIKHLRLVVSLNRLKRHFDDLDEQAKIIVKTDLELNKAQEELDKRIDGLDALHKTSRLISTALDENEVFKRLNQSSITELGFEKYYVCTFDEDNSFRTRVDFGFSEAEGSAIASFLEKDTDLVKLLKEGKLISSTKISQEAGDSLAKIFNVKHFIITPILAQINLTGILFAGNQSSNFTVTEGDEELISILADQIGQAIENARLFEQVYRSSQILETKVQERTKQLSSALEEVKKISKMKSEFISAVSHELRTPLTSIKGYASILMTGKVGAIPQQVKDRLEKINKHSDNLVKLINDLLDIARIESGRTEMKFTKQNMNTLVDNVEDLLTPQLKEKNIDLVKKMDSGSPSISMDVSQVERVLINLVSNAIKFTPDKGTITIATKLDNNKISVGVTDTGIGIKEEDTNKLFNEFYRVDNKVNQNVKGTGLGLALAKKIIEAHNGEIGVSSKVNSGSTFYFTIPMKMTTITE